MTATTASTASHPPDASPEALVGRAEALRGPIRDQAAEAEALGHYVPAIHEAFRESGFYHMLTPRRYGGLEVDLRTFAAVIMEVGRGDPGTAWCLCLGQGHALNTAAFWPAQTQDEVFDTDAGYFRASHSANPGGTARRVDGGWLINARSPYQSGVPYATHATVSVQVVDDGDPSGPPAGPGGPGGPDFAPLLWVLVPQDQLTIVDDWGGDAVLGMRASGSNTVVVDNQIVPEHFGTFVNPERKSATSAGVRLHGNPMYLGAAQMGFAGLELASCVVGAARAALDEYEVLAQRSVMSPTGVEPRFKQSSFQRNFGVAKMKADCAEAIVLQVADTITRWSREMVDGVREITLEMDNGLDAMLLQAGHLACEAVDVLFCSAGTSASGRGQRMQRYLRDVSMYRTHRAAQYEAGAQRYGAMLFGDLPSMFGAPTPPPTALR